MEVARAHVARNLLAIFDLAEDGRDGGWAHHYTPDKMQDEPELQQTAASDIQTVLDGLRTRLQGWLP